MATTKLTLRLEADAIERAKRVAAERDTSVSALVEGFFRVLGTSEMPEGASGDGESGASGVRSPLVARFAARPPMTTWEDDRAVWHRHLDERYGVPSPDVP